MAHNLIYTFGHADTTPAETEWTLNIYQKDFTGTSDEIEQPAADPVKITYGESGNWLPDKPVVMSDMEFAIWASQRKEFASLVSPDATRNLVEYKRGSQVYWKGYIVTQLYSEPLELESAPVSFMAADLKILESFSFTLTGWKTQFEILRWCLDKLGFGFGYRIATSLKFTLFGSSVDMVVGLTDLCEKFAGKNCLEVVREILKPHFASIKQVNGRWHILGWRTPAENYGYIDFNSGGTQTGTGTFSGTIAAADVEDDLDDNFCMFLSGGRLESPEPIKNFKLIQNLGKSPNIAKNGNFEAVQDIGGIVVFDYWTGINAPVKQMKTGDKTWCLFQAMSTEALQVNGNRILLQVASDGFEYTTEQKIKIDIGYALIGDTAMLPSDMEAKGTLSVMIKCGEWSLRRSIDNETNDIIFFWEKYNQNSFSLTLGNQISTQDADRVSFNNYSALAPMPPESLPVEIILYGPHSCTPTPMVYTGGVIWGAGYTDVNVNVVDAEGNDLPDKIEQTITIDDRNVYVAPDVEIMCQQKPDEVVANELLAYTNITVPSDSCNYGGYTGNIQEMLAQQITDMYATLPDVIKARIYSDIFNIGSVLTDAEFTGKRFIPVYAVFEAQMSEWEVELISVNSDAEIAPDFNYPDFDDSDFNAG